VIDMSEYEFMYQKVLNRARFDFMSKDEIIEYLVVECYYLGEHNDIMQDKLAAISKIISPDNYPESYLGISEDDLPF